MAGTKNEYDAKLSCKKFVRILIKLNFKANFKEFKIQNIVCSYDMKSFISLEKINLFCENFSVYEPELFSGLILSVRKATILIFASRKVV